MRGVAIGGAIGIALVVAVPHWSGEPFRDWFASTLPAMPLSVRLAAVIAAAAATLLAAIVAHEVGHVLAGVAAGFRFHSIRIGRLQLIRPFRWSWSRSVGRGAAAVARVLPVSTDRLGPRAFAMILGGPTANLATAGLILALPSEQGMFSGTLLCWSLLLATMNLFPYTRGTFVSDGRRLVTLLRRGEQAHRWLALTVLTGELEDGVPPETLSPEFIAAAVAVQDESFDFVVAHMLAYVARFHQRDDTGAAEVLEACLSRAAHLPEAIRESLMCEAAVFQGRRRGRADLAKAWLEDVPATTTLPGIRQQAEAAVLQSRGDRAGARRVLDEAAARIKNRPNDPSGDFAIRMLRRWQAELDQP